MPGEGLTHGPPATKKLAAVTTGSADHDVSASTCGSFPVLFLCTGAAGAAGTRPSLRPLFSEGPRSMQNSGEIRREKITFV